MGLFKGFGLLISFDIPEELPVLLIEVLITGFIKGTGINIVIGVSSIFLAIILDKTKHPKVTDI